MSSTTANGWNQGNFISFIYDMIFPGVFEIDSDAIVSGHGPFRILIHYDHSKVPDACAVWQIHLQQLLSGNILPLSKKENCDFHKC